MVSRIAPGWNAVGVWLAASASPTRWISDSTLKGQTLLGTDGADYIYSPGGGATLAGGADDDTYFMWEMPDRVVEADAGGIDTLVTYAQAYRLPAFVENMSVEAQGASGTGNALANIIAGGDGAQLLDGGAGADILTGGAGADRFLFQVGTGWDIVTDFQPGLDKVVIGGGFAQFTSFAAVQAALTQSGDDAVLDLGGGDGVILRGVNVTTLTAEDVGLPAASITGLRATFADEFNSFAATPSGFQPDGTPVWRPTFLWGGRTLSSNNEVQYYGDATTVGPNPFALEEAAGQGVLAITARPAAGLPDGLTYSSGLITSATSHLQTYGFFEIRAQLPAGAGFWPAFWLLRADGTWPSELDVMEVLGDAPGRLHTTLHSQAGGSHWSAGGAYWAEDLSLGFHRFAVAWRPDFVTWYLDGTEVFRTATPDDMHSPMYMLANLAVGGEGSWPGPADGVSSATLRIDHIRAWQFADFAGPYRPERVVVAVLEGAGGHERLSGAAGADRISGRKGTDTLTGGAEADTFVFRAGDGKDVITDFAAGVDRLLLVGQSANGVTSKAGPSGLVVSYNGGRDTITLNGVKSLLAGDIIFGDAPLQGGNGNDVLDRFGSSRAQELLGWAGHDTIRGGTGDDWNRGGQGSDVLSGGVGRDTFVFERWDGDDEIIDFQPGIDRILLRGVAAESVWVNPSRNAAGQSGLEINYGNSGDSIFLLSVRAIARGDIVFV